VTLNRYATRRDKAQPPIIKALESVGAEVWVIEHPVDLLVRFRQQWHLLEVKTPQGKKGTAKSDKRQQAQINFIESTKTPIVKTPLEALQAIGAFVQP
jgi:hypothetical protein